MPSTDLTNSHFLTFSNFPLTPNTSAPWQAHSAEK